MVCVQEALNKMVKEKTEHSLIPGRLYRYVGAEFSSIFNIPDLSFLKKNVVGTLNRNDIVMFIEFSEKEDISEWTYMMIKIVFEDFVGYVPCSFPKETGFLSHKYFVCATEND